MNRPLQFFCLLLALCLSMFAVSPGHADDAATGAAKRSFVYVSVSGENRIAVYSLDRESGALVALGSVELEGSPGAMAVGRQTKTIYAAVRSTGAVAALQIDAATAMLKAVKTTPVAGNPVYLAVDRTGKHLLTSYYGDGKAAVYPIASDHTIGTKATYIVSTQKNPHSILIDAANRFVYVPNTGSDLILQYKFDAGQGTLAPCSAPQTETAAGDGPRHVWFHPNGRFIYFVNEKSSSVTAFAIDKASGDLTALQTISTLPDDFDGRNTCADIELTPSGDFLYASNRGHDSIAGFAVDASTGKLKSIGQFATEKTPRSFNIDPGGNYLIAAGQASGKLAGYRIDAETGRLDRQETYDVGKSPAWVQIVELP